MNSRVIYEKMGLLMNAVCHTIQHESPQIFGVLLHDVQQIASPNQVIVFSGYLGRHSDGSRVTSQGI